MRQLRSALARCLMVWLVAVFVMGSLGMVGAVAQTAPDSAHMIGQAAQTGSDCPTMDATGKPVQKDHAACTMTVCCFSEVPGLGALQPEFELMPANYVLSAEARLPQAKPERAKKPPRHI